MECPKCGNEVSDTEKICPFCKKVLQLECPICHKYNKTSVCTECGHVIIQKCHNCGTPGPNTGKCRKCGFDTAKSVIMNEAETDEYACLAITFPNLEDLRPALKNKQIFNKFKKKLKEALFNYAKEQDNRMQRFDETFVIKYYKEFSFTSSVKKAVKSAIELLNKIGGISYKLKKAKNVRLHCKMTILKKTFETDNNEFNTGLNIKLIKDNTEEKYTDGLQLITDQYINSVISRDYTLEMIYSSQVGDELLMFYEFPLDDQIVPIVIEDKPQNDKGILKGPRILPKLKIDDDEDQLNDILYGNKAINISTEGQFLSVPAHNVFNVLNDLLTSKAFITLKTTERRDLPTSDVLDFLNNRFGEAIHVVCKDSYSYNPYAFFKDLIAKIAGVDPAQAPFTKPELAKISKYDKSGHLIALLNNKPSEDLDPDSAYIAYVKTLREFLEQQRNIVIFIENIDLIDETSLKIINDFISTLINAEDLKINFITTARSDYSVLKNIPKLLHSPFYKELNVTKGDFAEFLAKIPESTEEINDSFYIHKLEERCAGSLIYFKNELQYLRDLHIFISFEGKLLLNTEKTIVFPGTIQELFIKRFTSLRENEGLVLAYAVLMDGQINNNLLEKLNIEKLPEAIQSLCDRALIRYENSVVEVENYRILKPAILKALALDVKVTLTDNLKEALNHTTYELFDVVFKDIEKLDKIYEKGMTSLLFGDFNAFLTCSRIYFSVLDTLDIREGILAERKNEMYSILVNHLNRYPSTKVYSISKAILANAMANNDDETIVNVSNLILDSALNGGDYVLAQQCIQNILTRILNPNLVGAGQDFSPQFVLYSCIHAKVAFHLSHYNQCISICEKIISMITAEFMVKIENSEVDSNQFISYVMEVLVYSALSRLIICDGTMEEFLSSVKDRLGAEIISAEYLVMLEKLVHLKESDATPGAANDIMSMYLAAIMYAFKNFKQGYETFAQNVYKAKLVIPNDTMHMFSLICDLLIGYSYQKLALHDNGNWKKTESIYEDVYKTAKKSGFMDVVQLTNLLKASLLKDKNVYEEAYELIVTVSNVLKNKRIKNRLLILMAYILTLNIVSKLKKLKHEIPVLVYRITYIAEKYNLEEYYKFIEDQRVLNKEYMAQFKEAIAAEKAAIEEENKAEVKADEEETKEINEGKIPTK